jgi:hypothetical protein
MDKWTPIEVLLFALLLMLVVTGLSNRQLIPYINATRGLKGPRVPINGRW